MSVESSTSFRSSNYLPNTRKRKYEEAAAGESRVDKIKSVFINQEQLLLEKYTIIRNLLSKKVKEVLLNGSVEWELPLSKKRSVGKVWKGCYNLGDDDVKYFGKVLLADGRRDIHIPPSLAKKTVPLDEAKLLGSFPAGFRIASYQLLINPTNKNTQEWHQDHGGLGADDYYTLLIPLTDEKGMGKTEVKTPYTKKFSKSAKVITPDVKAGDGLLFSGSLWHRGTPNHSDFTRYCIYMVITRAPQEKIFEDWK